MAASDDMSQTDTPGIGSLSRQPVESSGSKMPGAEAPSLEELDFASRVGRVGKAHGCVPEVVQDHVRSPQMGTTLYPECQ